jgi:hypothetical protein
VGRRDGRFWCEVQEVGDLRDSIFRGLLVLWAGVEAWFEARLVARNRAWVCGWRDTCREAC